MNLLRNPTPTTRKNCAEIAVSNSSAEEPGRSFTASSQRFYEMLSTVPQQVAVCQRTDLFMHWRSLVWKTVSEAISGGLRPLTGHLILWLPLERQWRAYKWKPCKAINVQLIKPSGWSSQCIATGACFQETVGERPQSGHRKTFAPRQVVSCVLLVANFPYTPHPKWKTTLGGRP